MVNLTKSKKSIVYLQGHPVPVHTAKSQGMIQMPAIPLTVNDVSAAAGLPADNQKDYEEGELADQDDQDDEADDARHAALLGRVAHDRAVACMQDKRA